MASFNLRQPSPRAPRERVTLDDVAAAAGVSRQTVSNVVNGTGRLSERTRSVVTEAITALDYHPHGGARGLRSRKTMLLGHPMPLFEPVENNWVMTEWVGALVTAAGDRGYHVLLTAGGGVEAVESLARSGTVDAFVLADVGRRDIRAAFLARQGIPFTCFGRLDRPLPQSWVDIDDRAAIRGVVAHLAKGGTGASASSA
jgi:DNA-binding LacI/PurR family transcriptional regulator